MEPVEIKKYPLSLNTFKFTVNTTDRTFQESLFDFLRTQNLLEVFSNTKIKMYSYTLNRVKAIEALATGRDEKYLLDIKEKGSVFFTLKITNKHDYSFSFDGLSELIPFDLPVSILGEKSDVAYANQTIYSDEGLIAERTSILQNCLKFIKEKGLYANSKIKSFGLSTTPEQVEYYEKIRLIKFNTDKKNGAYSSWGYKKSSDIYTSKINYYKAYIKYPQDIVENFKELSSDKIIKKLHKVLDKKLKTCEDIVIQKESQDRYCVKVNASCSMKFDSPIVISERNHLEFKLDIDSKSDIFKISHTSRKGVKQNLYRTTKESTNSTSDQVHSTHEATYTDFNVYQEIETFQQQVYSLFNVAKKCISISLDNQGKLKKCVSQISKDTQKELSMFHKYSSINLFRKDLKLYVNTFEEAIKSYNDSALNIIEDFSLKVKKISALSKNKKNVGNSHEMIELKDEFSSEMTKIMDDYLQAFEKFLSELTSDDEIKNGYYIKSETVYTEENSFTLNTKEQLTCSFYVNRWDTKHKEILEKYDEDKKHYYTLDDDLSDIVNHLMSFTSKYKLLVINDDALLNQVSDENAEHFKTKKKFQDMVLNDSNVTELMDLSEAKLTQYLKKLLDK
ncbi:MAG: hypothetical protein Q8M39_05015 [Sulfuricurvum sp.]|nr:hypothetical protein [Sulfuricurvum sp.]